MYKATVGDKTFEITQTTDGIAVDGNLLNWDMLEFSPGCFHIIHTGKSYRAEIMKADVVAKTFTIKVNNVVQTVSVKDKFDMLLEKMGMTATASSKINNVKAPMPGLIIDLRVKAGDTVNAGDALLILEAMKMENVLKSPGGGVVRTVKVKNGDSVEKGQILIEF
jgi:biotin carboxyl carrier protein